MRLTLRTLLALRNKTLGPDDEARLSEKVKDSRYAQSLLELIGNVVGNARLSAPPPTATGPTDDPNVMAEYLDSTLAPEQAAEVDRTCLESPVHLAEAAGAHEVLTLVLGKPADVPPALRDRVYRLSSHSVETLDAPDAGTAQPIMPVSLDDSGAFQAATRMQATVPSGGAAATSLPRDSREPAIAGNRPLNAAEAHEIFGDRLRVARVLPWLVTLVLIGAMLFVLKQAFAPLLDPNRSETAQKSDTAPLEDRAAADRDTTPTEQADTSDTPQTPLENPGTPTTAASPEPAPEANSDLSPSASPPQDAAVTPPTTAPPSEPPSATTPMPEQAQGPATTSPTEPAVRVADAGAAMTEPSVPEVVEVDPSADRPSLLTFTNASSSDSLLLGKPRGDQAWQIFDEPSVIDSTTTLVTPPTFRNTLAAPQQYELTLVGPTVTAFAASGEAPELELQSGRVVVSALAAETQIPLRTGARSVLLELDDVGATVAIDVHPFRTPGTDPTNLENRVFVTQATVVIGPVVWRDADGNSETLQTGEQWSQIGDGAGERSVTESIPQWINGTRQSLVEKAARENLLALLPGKQSVELELRGAVSYRRAEVGALAAQTLAMLGKPDIFFGTDGMLNTPSQKAYWNDHVATLKRRIDLSPAAAQEVRPGAASMDAASAEPLFRLLWDYSPEQLAAGADEFLVQTLDSPQMPLRVLAIEALRRITGTTLYYKPEQENAARRKNDVKKWEAKLRRQDIRWQAVPIAGVPAPVVE